MNTTERQIQLLRLLAEFEPPRDEWASLGVTESGFHYLTVHSKPHSTWRAHHCAPWRAATPTEALEVLFMAGEWPWEVGSAESPAWACVRCKGGGFTNEACRNCHATGVVAEVPSWSALVTVARYGVTTLRTVEGLFREIEPHAPIVWSLEKRRYLSSATVLATTLQRVDEALARYRAHLWKGTRWGVTVDKHEVVLF